MIRSEWFALYFLLPNENFVNFYVQPRYVTTILSTIFSKKSATLFVFLTGGSTYFGVLDFGMN